MENRKWLMENRKWKMVKRKWLIVNGKWLMDLYDTYCANWNYLGTTVGATGFLKQETVEGFYFYLGDEILKVNFKKQFFPLLSKIFRVSAPLSFFSRRGDGDEVFEVKTLPKLKQKNINQHKAKQA